MGGGWLWRFLPSITTLSQCEGVRAGGSTRCFQVRSPAFASLARWLSYGRALWRPRPDPSRYLALDCDRRRMPNGLDNPISGA